MGAVPWIRRSGGHGGHHRGRRCATAFSTHAAVSDAEHTLGRDDEQERRSRLLLRRWERSPAPDSRSRSQPGWTKARALVSDPASGAVARTGKRAALILRLVVRVIRCRREPAIVGRRSDASTTRNDTPSAAAVERVPWAPRHREERPSDVAVAVSIVTGSTQRLWMSLWSWPLGHSLGRTLPYWAASGSTPGVYSRDALA
jgi:hypothetical protein